MGSGEIEHPCAGWRTGLRGGGGVGRRRWSPPASERPASAPESAQPQRGESPLRAEHWRPVAEGNCVIERWGGEQPEANHQSVSNDMLNSIRPDALASLLANGEARNRKPARKGRGQLRRPTSWTDREHGVGVHGVAGDGMVSRGGDVNRGSRAGSRDGVHGLWPEEPSPEGDRALIRAWKRSNARRAKEGREMERGCASEGVNGWRSAVRLCAPATMGSASPDDSRLSLNRKERPVPGLPGQRSFQRSATITGKPDAGDPPVRFGRGGGG